MATDEPAVARPRGPNVGPLNALRFPLRGIGEKDRVDVILTNPPFGGEEEPKEFNLHTIVRLPNGVFAPYTSIPTNVLFFNRAGPTEAVWFYEQPLPVGRKNDTKTAPIQFDEFADCIRWWPKREENDRAWKVPAAELLANGCNLDRKNPRAKEDVTHLPPDQLAASILKKEQRIAEIMGNIQRLLTRPGADVTPGPLAGAPRLHQ